MARLLCGDFLIYVSFFGLGWGRDVSDLHSEVEICEKCMAGKESGASS